jgi:asparagine synthase (glutamine-hydrolysing)
MCGICGIFNFDPLRQVNRATVTRMNDRIAHRGPDDAGYLFDKNFAFAMRRLCVIDLKTGQQPMKNEDGSIHLVYNGELYNHPFLRSQLEAHGHCFRSRTDTETIVHLYEEHGTDCVRFLRGMFAFAIWDQSQRKLILARDRFGIKPLYYHLSSERIAFASEIKSLLLCLDRAAQLNHDALPEYLAFGYISGQETLFSGIRKLPPGHLLVICEDGIPHARQFGDLPSAQEYPTSCDTDYVAIYQQLLQESVATHLVADVPIGVFLSGGLDSSVIAALASKLRHEQVRTFSVGYADSRYSELPYARLVAQHIGAVHREVEMTEKSFFELLPWAIWHEDEPLAWPSSVPLFALARLAAEDVKVVLTGEGSDETLAGYARYLSLLRNIHYGNFYRKTVPRFLQQRVARWIDSSALLTAAVRRRLQHTVIARDSSNVNSIYLDSYYAAFSSAEQHNLLGLKMSFAARAYDTAMQLWDCSPSELLSSLLSFDIKTYLVEVLMKQDNMSMAASIESRVPFLDHRLVDFALQIPAHMKIRGGVQKYVLKSAARDLLPPEIIYRDKMGFPTPFALWLEGERLGRIEQLLQEPRALSRELFNPESIRRLCREHRLGHRDNTDKLWRLLNLELWHRVFIDAGDWLPIADMAP